MLLPKPILNVLLGLDLPITLLYRAKKPINEFPWRRVCPTAWFGAGKAFLKD